MAHRFNCIATGIGSLPLVDPDEAVALSLKFLPEAPIWPQLPQRSILEHFCRQYSEGMPGLAMDSSKQSLYFDTSRDLSPALERFYERYLAKDLGHFSISEDHAAGFHDFVAKLKKDGLPPAARFLKGHCTDPLTFGITVKDSDGRDIVYHDILFDAITKGLAMKAAWQVRTLKQFGLPVILFIDDPAMYALSSGLYSLSPDLVAGKLREIITMVHDEGGIAGIHCCGNADWPLLFRTSVDIISFDAVGYLNKVLMYCDEIKEFFHRGGSLAWGIVPTTGFTGSETADGLVGMLKGGITRLCDTGIDRSVILRQCIITPSCGLGSLTTAQAEAILKLTREVSDEMQKQI
ncbi:MAG: methionine synthase [Nitrospirota bacterium]